MIRFTVTSPRTTANDIARDWQIIRTYAQEIVGGESGSAAPARVRVRLKGIFATMRTNQNINKKKVT